METPPLVFTDVLHDDAVQLHVTGDLDHSTTPQLRARVRQLLTTGPHRFVIDLAEVTFCDSMAIAVLIQIKADTTAAACQLALTNPRPDVALILKITGVDEYLGLVTPPKDQLDDPAPA